jgi:probable rRNA maturation factor
MTKRKPKISFHLLYKFPLKGRKILKDFLLSIFKQEDKNVDEVNYIFCSDDYLLQLNQQHLQHDFFTDIITFPFHEDHEDIKADIFISIERVADNADLLNIDFNEELLRVMIHGALHLCSYGDKTKSELAQMRNLEDKYLQLVVSRETKP